MHGTKGAVFWDFRRRNELGVSRGDRYQDQPVSTVHMGPGEGEYEAFRGSANAMGYDDLKVIEAYRFLRSIAEGTAHGAPPHRRRAQCDRARSARSGAWAEVSEQG
ncbi:hypothetical protein ACFWWT_37655 [Streptomyces sp. NPDC058676]|uniref:hypothetical protein n=1 Tax=unclassified Streptomyces TaxID=2593676 RepID=UPI00366512C4